MQFVILGLLLTESLSLYDVHKRFSGSVSLFYSASFGALRRALGQLVDAGHATVADAADVRRGKKLYRITLEGRDAWLRWMLQPIIGAEVETTMLAKVYLLGRLERATDRQVALAGIRERLDADHHGLSELAVTLDATLVADEHRDLYRWQRATLDYGLRSHELALSWIRDLEASA